MTTRQRLVFLQCICLLIAGALIVVGALTPWAIRETHLSGFDVGEGKSTFALGLVLLGLATLRVIGNGRRLDAVVSVIAAGVSGAVIAIALPELMRMRSEVATFQDLLKYASLLVADPPPRVGYGLHLTVAGGCLAGIGALAGLLLSWETTGWPDAEQPSA